MIGQMQLVQNLIREGNGARKILSALRERFPQSRATSRDIYKIKFEMMVEMLAGLSCEKAHHAFIPAPRTGAMTHLFVILPTARRSPTSFLQTLSFRLIPQRDERPVSEVLSSIQDRHANISAHQRRLLGKPLERLDSEDALVVGDPDISGPVVNRAVEGEEDPKKITRRDTSVDV
ncbi:hypothetical protein PsorP6_006593 [Peronosclerospora sorghi]|uniref:Uncharacterized protein n=1 Tax=Peronosclerospora sorghi TaxID=230839 RepID=A0ACC0W4L7_9STRA|nr:hypothetical protein PsorP6_006593 [Peronosclerospora sorghi]